MICQRCERERRLGGVGGGGGAGSLSEPPAGRELLGSAEQVGEAVPHATPRPGWMEASPGAQKPPGASPTLVPVNAPAVLLMQPPVLGQIEAAILDHVPSLISPRTFPGLVRSHPEL